jgi:hypothetical protein
MVAGFRADKPYLSGNSYFSAAKKPVTRSANPIKTKISVWLYRLNDKTDFIHVRAEHQKGLFLTTAPACDHIPILIDRNVVGACLKPLANICNDLLFKSRNTR